jgi:MoxR-like ATPase
MSEQAPRMAMAAEEKLAGDDLQAVRKLQEGFQEIKRQLGRVIVGQDQVIEELLIALFSRGHCILEGVPGLAKTLMISTLSKCLSLAFSRIQFTPDLMPSDITGTEVIEENRSTGHREFKFLEGPLFANIILADEINRTPPKTQAALLEAMQERQVTVGRVRHRLSDPFFVLATQNPIEQEGTYPLPEAQQDRFMFKVFVKYPNFKEEFEIARRTTSLLVEDLQSVLTGEQILDLQRLVRRVPVTDHVIQYTLALVRQTRVSEPGVPRFIKDWLSWGAGPRSVRGHPGPGLPGPASPLVDQLHRRLRRHHYRYRDRKTDSRNPQPRRRTDSGRALQEDFCIVIWVERKSAGARGR